MNDVDQAPDAGTAPAAPDAEITPVQRLEGLGVRGILRQLARDARSSTCVARCPSATASAVVATSTRDRRGPGPIGSRLRTTIRDSRRTEVTSRPTVRLAHRLCNRRDYTWRM